MSDTDKSKGQQDPKKKKNKARNNNSKSRYKRKNDTSKNQTLTESASISRVLYSRHLSNARIVHNMPKQ